MFDKIINIFGVTKQSASKKLTYFLIKSTAPISLKLNVELAEV